MLSPRQLLFPYSSVKNIDDQVDMTSFDNIDLIELLTPMMIRSGKELECMGYSLSGSLINDASPTRSSKSDSEGKIQNNISLALATC